MSSFNPRIATDSILTEVREQVTAECDMEQIVAATISAIAMQMVPRKQSARPWARYGQEVQNHVLSYHHKLRNRLLAIADVLTHSPTDS